MKASYARRFILENLLKFFAFFLWATTFDSFTGAQAIIIYQLKAGKNDRGSFSMSLGNAQDGAHTF